MVKQGTIDILKIISIGARAMAGACGELSDHYERKQHGAAPIDQEEKKKIEEISSDFD